MEVIENGRYEHIGLDSTIGIARLSCRVMIWPRGSREYDVKPPSQAIAHANSGMNCILHTSRTCGSAKQGTQKQTHNTTVYIAPTKTSESRIHSLLAQELSASKALHLLTRNNCTNNLVDHELPAGINVKNSYGWMVIDELFCLERKLCAWLRSCSRDVHESAMYFIRVQHCPSRVSSRLLALFLFT